MERGWIEFVKWPYEEEIRHCQVTASDGTYVATQEFYARLADFDELGRALAAFPRSAMDEVLYEVGKWLRLRAYLYDTVGHAALLFEVCNDGQDPCRAEARFTIRCQVASLNRLGRALVAWAKSDEKKLHEELTPVEA